MNTEQTKFDQSLDQCGRAFCQVPLVGDEREEHADRESTLDNGDRAQIDDDDILSAEQQPVCGAEPYVEPAQSYGRV